MTTFYVGYRNVLKGRDADASVHFWKNVAGTYSNWELQNSSHVLDGAPDTNTALGTERPYSKFTLLEYLFTGKQHVYPMAGAGDGERLDDARFKPHEYKGLTNQHLALGGSGLGHAASDDSDYALYSNFIFDGISIAQALSSPGHTRSFTATYGGASDPNVWHGVAPSQAMIGVGQTLPATAITSEYGHNKVNEWRGVPSSHAL